MLSGAQKFPPSGEPQHSGTGTPPPLYPSRKAVITEPKPQQRQGDIPLKNTALFLNRTWLLGLNTTRAKSTPKTRDWRQPVMLIFNTPSPPASVQFKDMVFLQVAMVPTFLTLKPCTGRLLSRNEVSKHDATHWRQGC